jgi:hypothetical protein
MIHGWSAFGGPTMVDTKSKWEDELGRWLKPFLDRLGHKARRRMCPLYISGLIGPGDRKSVQPMAARLAPGEYDQLHHFIADGVWDAAKAAGRKKRISGPPPQPSMPAIRQAILDLFARPPPRQCPHCDMFLADIAKPKVPK